MASPGQRHEVFGHKMARFDMHEICARRLDKALGSDACIVGGAICKICDSFNEKWWLHHSNRYARTKNVEY